MPMGATHSKVENILKGSLDLISLPSRSREHLYFLFIMFCLYTSTQAIFPAHNLNFLLKVKRSFFYFTESGPHWQQSRNLSTLLTHTL
jgi:hypothetical protein